MPHIPNGTSVGPAGPAAPRRALRTFREALEAFSAQGHLARISKPVDPRYELAAVASELHRQAIVQFDRVRGYRMPVVANLLYARERIADALGVSPDELVQTLADAVQHGVAPRLVQDAPCQEVVIEQPDLPQHLPVPTFFEQETGPYITAGVIVARHPATGRRNVSIARAKLLGGNRLMLGIAPNHHLARMIAESVQLGRPLELAITIGNAPAVLMASNFYVDYGHDEYDIAGALLGEPLAIVPARTVGVEVPRDCEIVIEGTVADEWVHEGPVSEFHGMYENYGQGVVMTATALTHRRDALFQAILPGYHAEHMLIGAEAIAATILHNVRRAVPGVRDVHVPLSGGGRLQAVVVLDSPSPGEAQKAIFAVWAHVNLVKQVVVVDADIDPRNPEQVGYALATRFRGQEDLVIVPGVRADRADPIEKDRTVTKIGVVALKRPHGSRREFTPADVPAEVRRRVRDNWHEYIP